MREAGKLWDGWAGEKGEGEEQQQQQHRPALRLSLHLKHTHTCRRHNGRPAPPRFSRTNFRSVIDPPTPPPPHHHLAEEVEEGGVKGLVAEVVPEDLEDVRLEDEGVIHRDQLHLWWVGVDWVGGLGCQDGEDGLAASAGRAGSRPRGTEAGTCVRAYVRWGGGTSRAVRGG